jgi:NAD(P)H dehydrogenase (quinone)
MTRTGVDDGTRGFRVGMDINFAEDTLSEVSGQLSRLIGRPTTPLLDTLQSLG